ncbi:MAG TPA: hypothetical protein VM432_11970 [Bdellovibrionales bacterium]|nr:hypothetical protein [Bdellovibrionales bacterium]
MVRLLRSISLLSLVVLATMLTVPQRVLAAPTNACALTVLAEENVLSDPYTNTQVELLRERTLAIAPKTKAKRILKLLEAPVSQDRLLDASFHFVIVASNKLNPPKTMGERLEYGLNALEYFNKANEYTHSIAALAPTFEDLSRLRIMQMWGEHRYPIGISESVVRADGTNFKPMAFAVHDLAHATAWIMAVYDKARELRITPVEVLQRFAKLNSEVLLRISNSDLSHAEQERLLYLWFTTIHERYKVVTTPADFDIAEGPMGSIIQRVLIPSEEQSYLELVGIDRSTWMSSVDTLKSLIQEIE